MTDSVKPASALWLRFAELYAGDGAAAMAAAGSTASAASRASMASRALRHPDVQAVLERRRQEARASGGIEPARAETPAPAPLPRREPQPTAEPADLDENDVAEQRRVSVRRAVAEAEAAGVDPIAVLEEIALGPDVHASSRVAAAKALERHQRETNNAAADPFADLRARVSEILRKKRERERD